MSDKDLCNFYLFLTIALLGHTIDCFRKYLLEVSDDCP